MIHRIIVTGLKLGDYILLVWIWRVNGLMNFGRVQVLGYFTCPLHPARIHYHYRSAFRYKGKNFGRYDIQSIIWDHYSVEGRAF